MKQGIIHITIIAICLGLFSLSSKNSAQEKKQTPEALETEEKTVRMLNELIKKNSVFSIKIAHHLLPTKVTLWRQRGILKLPMNTMWESFIKDVHQFGVHLHSMLEKDPKAVYYHIDSLRKDHALYHLLAKLNLQTNNLFSQDEPGSVLKIEKAQNLVRLINVYAMVFYNEKLLAQIKAFFKKFELRAKKMRAQAERAERAAGADTPSYEPSFEYDDTITTFEYTPTENEDFDITEEDYSWLGGFADEDFSFE